MITTKKLVISALVLASLLAFGRFFVSQLATGKASGEPVGIVLSPPPDVTVMQGGEVTRTQAASQLMALIEDRDTESRLAIHFFPGDRRELYWIADRSISEKPFLIERSSGPGGTRLETRWQGSIEDRLAWALSNGNLDAPDLPAGEQRNLYH